MPQDLPPSPGFGWMPIDGAYQTELAFGPPPGGGADCNTYLLRTPEYALVLDPGADPARADRLLDTVRALALEMPRQVVVFLTHCHADHCHAMGRILDAGGVTASLACHKIAADVLRSGEGALTGAEALGLSAPRAAQAMGLFALAGGGVSRDMQTPGGGLRSLSIPISPRDAIRVYHAPGHSPDSLCFRVGCALFIGDAACGDDRDLPGHDPEARAATLAKLLWLMDHANIVTVYPGHGAPMPRAQAMDHFKTQLGGL